MTQKNPLMFKVTISIAIAIICAALAILFAIPSPKKKEIKQQNHTDISMKYNGPKIGGNFILVDQNNKTFDSTKLHGKYMLLYFGFTFCPDICPASLAEINQIPPILKKYNKNIKYIFISIDPKRDTPEQLKNYFSSFPHITALTGNNAQVQKAADTFKVYHSVALDGKQNTDHYMVNHSSFFYLVNDKGEMIKIYPSGSKGIDMGYDILKYMKKTYK